LDFVWTARARIWLSREEESAKESVAKGPISGPFGIGGGVDVGATTFSLFHRAYNVVEVEKGYVAPLVYECPDPFAEVFQSTKVYPAREKWFGFNGLGARFDSRLIAPRPPLATNVTTFAVATGTFLLFHWA
jgi:hypothetical protein